MLTRQESRFLSERLEFEDLRQVGHYSGDWKQVKDKRVITFSKGEMGIEFTFQRGDYSSKESLNDLIEIASSTNTDNFQRAAEGMILNVAAGQKNKHPSEMLLGQESRTLKHYELTSVVKVTTKPKVVLSFEIPGFFTKERDVLYPLVK